MGQKNRSLKTICRICNREISVTDRKEKFVLCCGRFHVVGNYENVMKSLGTKIYIDDSSNKINKIQKGGKMEEQEKPKRGWQKKAILESLTAGKTIAEIAAETGIKTGRINRVKKKFFDTK